MYEDLKYSECYAVQVALEDKRKSLETLTDREFVAYAYWHDSNGYFKAVINRGSEDEVKEAIALMREALLQNKEFHACFIMNEGIVVDYNEDESEFGWKMWLT